MSYEVDLSGAKELDRNPSTGRCRRSSRRSGPKVVVNFLFINVAFQLGFYLLLQLQTD